MTEAQRLLERTLTDEERELLEWHSPKAGWWRREKRDDICQGCAFGLIENCVTRNVIFALAESRAREGELVAALELARHKAEQIRDGQCNPVARADAIIQVARAALGEKA